jgi:2-iminobutanoate/2-iminopropanoate deaminase
MSLEIISTPTAPAPGGHYSQAIRVGDTVTTAGQVGLNPATGEKPDTFAGEVHQSLANLKAVLEAAGSSLDNVIKTTCFITDVANFAEFNAIYAEVFGEHRPARSTFGVALAGGFTFEIEAVALVAE